MRYHFMLLFFLTLGMRPMGYDIRLMRVQEVRSCIVTMADEDGRRWRVWSDEAWRTGDFAEAITFRGKVVELRREWTLPRTAAARRHRSRKVDTLELAGLKGDPAEGIKTEPVGGSLLTKGENRRPKPTGHH